MISCSPSGDTIFTANSREIILHSLFCVTNIIRVLILSRLLLHLPLIIVLLIWKVFMISSLINWHIPIVWRRSKVICCWWNFTSIFRPPQHELMFPTHLLFLAVSCKFNNIMDALQYILNPLRWWFCKNLHSSLMPVSGEFLKNYLQPWQNQN